MTFVAAPSSISTTKPANRRNRIVAELRARIVSGELAPGAQLPRRSELETRFDASSHTVQDAMHRLISDGFIEADAGRGTFVTRHPPHLNHYALVFHGQTYAGWSRCWEAFAGEAANIEKSTSLEFTSFFGVDGHADVRDHRRLIDQIESQRLAGIIFASNPFHLLGSAILETPGIPRVAFMTASDPRFAEVSVVKVDSFAFIDRALEFLARRGRRRIAMITNDGFHHKNYEYFMAGIARHGMTSLVEWTQLPDVGSPAAMRNAARLLVTSSRSATDRPDGLIISDDNFVEHTTNGLLGAGVRTPDELNVVAHCNFPVLPPCALEVMWLGFEASQIMATMLDALKKKRSGVLAAPLTSIPPVFGIERVGDVR